MHLAYELFLLTWCKYNQLVTEEQHKVFGNLPECNNLHDTRTFHGEKLSDLLETSMSNRRHFGEKVDSGAK